MCSFSAKCHSHGRLTAHLQIGFLPEPVSLQPGTEATCPGERLVAKLCPRSALEGGALRVSSGGRREKAELENGERNVCKVSMESSLPF